MQSVTLNGTQIPVKIISTRKRRIKMWFPEDPILYVEVPGGKVNEEVHGFIQQKASWIVKHYHKKRSLDNTRQKFFDNLDQGKVLFLGEWRPLVFQLGKSRKISREEDRILVCHKSGDLENGVGTLLYPALRALSKNHLNRRTRALAEKTQSTIKGIRVKDLKTRWGSCSTLTNINLNWYLIFLPPHLVDYVIIHELMHLRQMNHSAAFWAEVAKYCPDYKKSVLEMREFGWVIGMLEGK
jgi:predicted metal-dependent hydrolase